MMADLRTALSGPEAEAAVARRLAELGRDPWLVTEDAVAALRGCAESGEALRSVLTGALFLASTEDAPQVNASHVERAAAMRPPPAALAAEAPAAPSPAPAAPAASQARARPRAPAAAILAAAAAALAAVPAATLALRETYAPPELSAPAPSQPQAAPLPTVVAAPPVIPPPVASAEPAAAASPPARTAPAASAAPVAPGPALVRTRPALPESVRQVVLLSYARGVPEAEARADALASALRARGIAAAVVADGGLPTAASVGYFFADDRELAERVGAILGGAWQLNTKPLRATGRDLPQPGAIRVNVPAGG